MASGFGEDTIYNMSPSRWVGVIFFEQGPCAKDGQQKDEAALKVEEKEQPQEQEASTVFFRPPERKQEQHTAVSCKIR